MHAGFYFDGLGCYRLVMIHKPGPDGGGFSAARGPQSLGVPELRTELGASFNRCPPVSQVPKELTMSTRLQIAGLVFMMVNAVAFGVGIVPVLLIPALANNAFETIPAVVIASFAVSAPLSWFVAPRLRARYWRTHAN